MKVVSDNREGRKRRFEAFPGIALLLPAASDPAEAERRLRTLSRVLLWAGVSIPILGLLPELIHLTPDLNDGSFHQGIARNTIAAFRDGLNPLDFWLPTWLCGFPLFHYYQPGPYLLLALAYFLSAGKFSILFLYHLGTIGALALFPLANYVALRWLRMPRETAGWGAFLACLISGRATYGIEMTSFTWTGYGLFAQATALPLLPLALAGGWRSLEDGRKTLGYAAILAAAFMLHILYGYIAALSLVLVPFVALRRSEIGPRLLLLARFYAQSFALIAFFVVPFALHLAYHAKSLYDAAAKFDSHGAAVVLEWLFGGTLLDDGRLPVITVAAFAGLYLSARRWLERGNAVHGWIGCAFVFWILAYFGRATWGPLANLLPMSHGLHMERLSSAVQMFGLWLAAIALGTASRSCLRLRPRSLRATLGIVLLLVVVGPVLAERCRYFVHNASLVATARADHEREAGEFEPVLEVLRRSSGRVYAGRSGNWGQSYKVGQVIAYHLLSAEAVSQVGNAPFSWPLSTDVQIQLDWPDQPTYDLYDVDFLLTDQDRPPPDGSDLLVHSGRHRLYRLPAEGPFGLVSVPLAIAGAKDSIWYINVQWTKSPWAHLRANARLLLNGEEAEGLPVLRMDGPFRYVPETGSESRSVFDPGLPFAGPPPPRPHGSLSGVRASWQDAEVTVDLHKSATVLFKTTYHPWWHASLDGAAVPTVVLTPGMIGVQVPAGVHHLRLAYEAPWWKTGLLVFGILAAIAIDRWVSPMPRGKDRRKERSA